MEHSDQQQNQDPRVTEMEHSDQQQNQDPRMGEVKEQISQTRSELKQREDEVESVSPRMKQMEEELEKTRSDLKQREDEVESVSPRIGEMEEELEKTRSDLKQREDEVESVSPSETEMEHSHQQQNQDSRMGEMKEELEKTRSDLKEKDKELQSFKDRVAVDVALSMKTGRRFESMNSPVSRGRLKEMYEELWMQWPKIKKCLRSNQQSPESVKEMIQEKFKEAMLAMEKKKKQIDKVFGLDELSRGSASGKVQQYWQSTCQNLQLVLYHGRTEDADLKTPSSPCEGEKPQNVMESWSSKCYWLGCLMALNNPPLQPDWENHPKSMDRWDFFPRNVTAASGTETKQILH